MRRRIKRDSIIQGYAYDWRGTLGVVEKPLFLIKGIVLEKIASEQRENSVVKV
jgi:hypothetical protein